MRALLFSIAAVVTLGACGGPPAKITAPPPVAPPPPAYEVVRSANLGVLAADDRHVYWVDGGIHRRAHGGAAPAERLFVSDGWIDRLAVGSADVFFSDDGYRLRAIPKSGGAPSELAALDEGLTGLVADGDGAWVLTGSRLERWSREPDEKKLELPGAGTTLAIDRARGEAFVTVRDGDATLYRVDLASGKATALSSEWFFADALAIGVSGSSIVAAVRDGLVMMPRAGGEASFAMPATAYAIAVDDRGYAISTGNALIAQLRGEPPRVLGTSNQSWWSGSSPGVALGGGYAYHIVYATDDQGTGILRGEPRTGGASMLRVPDGVLSALAADGERVVGALDRGGESAIVELGARRPEPLVTLPDHVEELAADGGDVAFLAAGILHRVENGAAVARSDAGMIGIILHRGKVYWMDGFLLRGITLAGTGEPFVVADASVGVAEELIVGQEYALSLAFDDDHLYHVQRVLGSTALIRIDEQRRRETLWSAGTTDADVLDTAVAVIGDAAYISDSARVIRVPAAGGASNTIYTTPDDAYVQTIFAVGDHLLAQLRPQSGFDQLVELPLDGGAPRLIWSSSLDGGVLGMLAAGDSAVFMHCAELGAVLRIPVD